MAQPNVVTLASPSTSPSSSLNAALERLIEQQQHQPSNISISAIDRNNQLLEQLVEVAGLDGTHTQTTYESQHQGSIKTLSAAPISLDLDPGIISPITISMTTAPNKTLPTAQSANVPTSSATQDKGFITVFNGKDGTLRLTQETAKALGIDAQLRPPPQNTVGLLNQTQAMSRDSIKASVVPEQNQKPKSQQSIQCVFTNAISSQVRTLPLTSLSNSASASFSAAPHSAQIKNEACLEPMTVKQEDSCPKINENLMGKSVTVNLPSTTQARRMILIPTTEPDGTVTYLLKSPSTPMTKPVTLHGGRIMQDINPIHASIISTIPNVVKPEPSIKIVNTLESCNFNSITHPTQQQVIQIDPSDPKSHDQQPSSMVPFQITKPTVVGNRIHVPIRTSQHHSAVLTNVMRPIMTTGVVHTPGHVPRQHPMILPKPPNYNDAASVSGSQSKPAVAISKTKSQPKKTKQSVGMMKKSGVKLATSSRLPSNMKHPSTINTANTQKSFEPDPMNLEFDNRKDSESAAQSNIDPANFVIVEAPSDSTIKRSNGSLNQPLGAPDNPIQIVREGRSTFYSLQPITHHQVTRIAKVLKDTTPDFADHTISYKDVEKNIKYKILYPEEAFANEAMAMNKNVSNEENSFEDDETDEEDEDTVSRDIYLSPEELLLGTHPFFTKSDSRGPIRRKRGRPTVIERFSHMMFRKPKDTAKRLRKEFGFSEKTANALQKDIVDDQNITHEAFRSHAVGLADDNEEKITLSSSRTRSGRVSRPPIQIDQEYKPNPFPALSQESVIKGPPAADIKDTTKDNIEKEAAITSANIEPQPTPKAKRMFTVPPRYRCRVCHKMYLGDRKMNRHIKNYPGHGPIFEPPPPLPPPPPKMSDGITHKMPTALSAMPIIPLARNQLEDLVKNLDAELVLDVVAKKMFDNFSMWDLQMKKASLSKEKGLKVLEKLFSDTEKVLGELKKLVDNCLTDTKLTEKACPSIQMGEYIQLALSGHDSPWYLEQANHVPSDYHDFFGIEPSVMASMVSPRSESSNPGYPSNPMMQVNPPEMDDNTSSIISGASDKDGPSNSCQDGMGAQIVLEQNLGVGNRSLDEEMEEEEDDDTQDGAGEGPSKKHHDSGSQDDFISNHDDSSKLLSPSSNQSEDEGDMMNEKDGSLQLQNIEDNKSCRKNGIKDHDEDKIENVNDDDENDDEENEMDSDEVDPKQVLEQNGIDISCDKTHSTDENPDKIKNESHMATNDLAMEIESLVPTLTSGVEDNRSTYQPQKTRLPSFSSIIAGSPKTGTRESTDCNNETESNDVVQGSMECITTVASILSLAGSHDQENIVHSPCVSDHNPGSVASVLSRQDEPDILQQQVAAAIVNQHNVINDNDNHLPLISGHAVLMTGSRRSSIAHSEDMPQTHASRRASVDQGGIGASAINNFMENPASISSRRSSFDHHSIHSGPPSVDLSHQQAPITSQHLPASDVCIDVVPTNNLALGELPRSGPASVDLNPRDPTYQPSQIDYQQEHKPDRNQDPVLKSLSDHQNLTHTGNMTIQHPNMAPVDNLGLMHMSHSGPPSVDVQHFQHLDQQPQTESTKPSSHDIEQNSIFADLSSSLAPLMEDGRHLPSSPLIRADRCTTVLSNSQRHIQSMPNSPLASTIGLEINVPITSIPPIGNGSSVVCKSQASPLTTNEPLDLLSSLVNNTESVSHFQGSRQSKQNIPNAHAIQQQKNETASKESAKHGVASKEEGEKFLCPNEKIDPSSSTEMANPHVMGVNNSNDDVSEHFLSDLESVLGDTNSFSFSSALSVDHEINLAKNSPTAEKLLLKSIPPSSMMKPKKNKDSGSSTKKLSKPAKEKRGKTSSSQTRTDFLGAFTDNKVQKSTVNEASEGQEGSAAKLASSKVVSKSASIDQALTDVVQSTANTFSSKPSTSISNALSCRNPYPMNSATLDHESQIKPMNTDPPTITPNKASLGIAEHCVSLNDTAARDLGENTGEIDPLSELFDEEINPQEDNQTDARP